ncbi:dihydroneopterin aldolase [Litorimonas taeanensis]|uniref:7,8-dihydroneopterin aldolase n=1 Tax=Litorimonas taeanensis TaxID=568099 RepID=A0A420WJR1_9PROT|nr:dihydroneopterin aldolase [Litorimonas taeanensis]RKQ71247.1 dihydroneopterin aldolase [Litorimonas taeanensis]
MTRTSILRRLKDKQALEPTTRIFVRGLLIQASIGVHPHEHEESQPIIVDVELDMSGMSAPTEDRLHETLDYSVVAEKAEALALEAHVQLVETLAERIADWALSYDSRVLSCAVRISKPQALLKAEAAGVEILRRR